MITIQSPSNIALVKYMGKKDKSKNLPENASVSMTLDSLCSIVQIQETSRSSSFELLFSDEAPLGEFSDLPEFFRKPLSEKDQQRFLKHFEHVVLRCLTIFSEAGLKGQFKVPSGQFVLRSANTFPAGSGIASSASSFSALTLATASLCVRDLPAFRKAFDESLLLRRKLASLSQEGSGSSCRSFEGPFVRWAEDKTESVSSSLEPLYDYVILVSNESKSVSSSEAHQRVKTSPLWVNRVDRANERCSKVIESLSKADWQMLCELAAKDSAEMHSLFHTADPAFMYWTPETVRWLRLLSQETDFLVTLDAGPNLHVIVRESDRTRFESFFEKNAMGTRYLVDRQGNGARFR